MSLFDNPIGPETYATVRFGLGYPNKGAPLTPVAILNRLRAPDTVQVKHPPMPFSQTVEDAFQLWEMKKARKADPAIDVDYKKLRKKILHGFVRNAAVDLARTVDTDDPFRERLQIFWVNHFAMRSKRINTDTGHSGYAAEAIRPYMTGSFGDLLKSAVLHPMMLLYLDQTVSVGPNSPIGRKKASGLNENLAREVLELHSLGVGAPYSQTDVTQLAELFTGLSFAYRKGFKFLKNHAEPGPETILGVEFGVEGEASLSDIHAVLERLAVHPETARHISTKLATYFVSDMPDPDLVRKMTNAFLDSRGWLPDVYAAMLEHPVAWSGFGAKVKWPFEYIASGLRASGVDGDTLKKLSIGKIRKSMLLPMRQMGQNYRIPPSPDGWPDRADAWIHPHGLAARISWAMALAQRLPGGAPSPRRFVKAALGGAAGSRLVWTADVAESRAEGVGIVLSSAEFNRR